MKILHSLVFFLPYKIGGIEVYVNELAKAQQQVGNEVVIVIPIWPDWPIKADYIHESIPVRTYWEKPNITPKEFQGLVPSASLHAYREILEQEKPDIVHFHQLNASNGVTLFHLEVAKKIGAKIVFTAHLAGTTCYTNNLLYKQKELCNGEIDIRKCTSCVLQRMGVKLHAVNYLLLSINVKVVGKRWNIYHLTGGRLTYLSVSEQILIKQQRLEQLFSTSDAVITLSKWYYEVMMNNRVPKQKLHLVKQGYGGIADTSKRISTYNKNRPFRILFLGRISPEKGLHLLLDSIKDINPDQMQLSIYGQLESGEYSKVCRDITDLLPNVHWYDPLPSDQVLDVMQQNDVLCIPSTLAEMAPLVLQEARAVGLCVIGAAIGGINDEIEDNKTGWLFPVNDVQYLKSIIEKLINNPSLLQEIRSQQPQPRTFKTIMEEMDIIYSEILRTEVSPLKHE